nr:hypothetical protein BaRGS_006974 [Batillaria attramentaria]
MQACSLFIAVVTLWAYLTLGAVLFRAIEADHEIQRQEDILKRARTLLGKASCLAKEDLLNMLNFIQQDTDLARYVIYHNNATTDNDTHDDLHNIMWDMSGSYSFVLSVVTTIGFGHITPKTPLGRVMCMVYAVVGIPFMLLILAVAGEKMYQLFDKCMRCHDPRSGSSVISKAQRRFIIFLQGVVGMVIFFVFPATTNALFEKWTVLEAVYYTFITFTTIGFGDLVAANPLNRDNYNYTPAATPDAQTEASKIVFTVPMSYLSEDGDVPDSVIDSLMRSGVRDDRAQQHVLHCLQTIAKGSLPGRGPQIMFVLSQMQFQDYLSKPCYASATAMFPRPIDLKGLNLERGDFDVLIIHRHYGLLVGEIKAVGGNASERGLSEDKRLDDLVKALKKMLKVGKKSLQVCVPIHGTRPREGLGQLEKAREVLRYMLSDLTPQPRVTATLILPFVTSQQLRRVLEMDSELKEALCRNLDIEMTDDPVEFCLCSDLMSSFSSPWHFPDEVLETLGHWWVRVFPENEQDPAMSDNVYEEMVSRFAGPGSVVSVYCRTEPRLQVAEVRTHAQAVSETHERLTQIALYPSQVDVLQENRDLVNLKGPPGTGKTLMLALKAVDWGTEKQPVNIVNTRDESYAATCLLCQQIKETLTRQNKKSAARNVRVHLLTTGDTDDEAVNDLLKTARNGQLSVIADEADGRVLSALYASLTSSGRIERLRLWAAGVKCANFPKALHEVTLTDPLRCPPAVVRELEQTKSLQNGDIPAYTTPSAPQPTDGPPVIDVYHSKDLGHDGDITMECEQCGLEIGERLKKWLHVGQVVNTSETNKTSTPAIRYRDVLILTWDRNIITEDKKSRKVQPSHKVVTGLRKAGLPVRIVGEGDKKGIEELAKMEGPDAVTLTGVYNVV